MGKACTFEGKMGPSEGPRWEELLRSFEINSKSEFIFDYTVSL